MSRECFFLDEFECCGQKFLIWDTDSDFIGKLMMCRFTAALEVMDQMISFVIRLVLSMSRSALRKERFLRFGSVHSWAAKGENLYML